MADAEASIALAITNRVSEITDCFHQQYMTVRALATTPETRARLLAFTQNLIVGANEFLNLSTQMTEGQISVTAELIVDEFMELNVADLKLAIRRGMSGAYGEIYNRVDGQVVLGWFRKYREQRFEYAEAVATKQHQQYKNEWKNRAPIAKELAEKLKVSLADKIDFKKQENTFDNEAYRDLKNREYMANKEIEQLQPVPDGLSDEERKKEAEAHKQLRFEILKKWGVV